MDHKMVFRDDVSLWIQFFEQSMMVYNELFQTHSKSCGYNRWKEYAAVF